MSEQLKRPQGIVPTIMHIRDMFEEMAESFMNYRDGSLSIERINEMERKIAEFSDEVKLLPEVLDKSYELIQMVIQSIHASRSELKKRVDGLLKKTGLQLQKVTSTTEEATNKILDVAEKLDEDQMKIIALIEELEELTRSGSAESAASMFEEVKAKVYQNQESAFLIMDYLQFQDITAQQIAGAYSLLSDTEKTLVYVSDLLKHFDTDRRKFDGAIHKLDPRSFNENATFESKHVLQAAIDELFETGEMAESAVPEEETAPEPEPESAESVDAGEIDNLFKKKDEKKDGGPATSQSDIDALFSTKKP